MIQSCVNFISNYDVFDCMRGNVFLFQLWCVSRCHMNWDNNSASSLFAHFTQKSFGIEFHSSSSTPLRDAARQCSQMRISRFKPSFLPFGESFQLGRKLLATPLLWSQISRCSSILSTFLFLPFILNFGADILSSSFILFCKQSSLYPFHPILPIYVL